MSLSNIRVIKHRLILTVFPLEPLLPRLPAGPLSACREKIRQMLKISNHYKSYINKEAVQFIFKINYL